MKNILVPTDFSSEAHHAYEVALQLAKQTGGSVTLLHVLEAIEAATANFSAYGGPVNGNDLPNGEGGMDGLFAIKLMEVTKGRMAVLKDEATTLAPGVAVQDAVETGRIGEGILSAIARHGADVVVMGAQGHGAMEEFFVGSNTERMIRLAPCPVLTVKHQQPQFEVRNIVFPSDFTAETAASLAGLREVQAAFPNATLHLLNVVGTDVNTAEAQQRLEAFAQQNQLADAKTAVATADLTSIGIQGYSQEVQADLVVIPTHGRTGLSSLLRSSIAETVATHSFPPVLTYHLD